MKSLIPLTLVLTTSQISFVVGGVCRHPPPAASVPLSSAAVSASAQTSNQVIPSSIATKVDAAVPVPNVDGTTTAAAISTTAAIAPSEPAAPPPPPPTTPAAVAPTTTPNPLPSTYPNPKFLQSRNSIRARALASFQALMPILTPEASFGWLGSVAWESVPQWDLLQNTRDFHEIFKYTIGILAKTDQSCGWGVDLVNCYNDDNGWAGLAALQGYESYGDQAFLDLAVGVWKFLTTHGRVTRAVVDSGTFPGVKADTVRIGATCNGQSTLGGVYWSNGGPSDALNANDYLAAVSTGNFALLSVELCRLTKDNTYCDFALESLQFIDRHLMNPDGTLGDGMASTTCVVGHGPLTYNQGLYAASYAMLGHLKGNQAYIDLATKTALASMTVPNWNSPQGVITEGSGDPAAGGDSLTWKSVLIRSLAKASPYLDASTQAAITQYINIQYWSVTQFDSDSNTHPLWYGRNWTGPGYSVYTGQSQMNILPVLNAVVTLNPDSAFPNPGDETQPVMTVS